MPTYKNTSTSVITIADLGVINIQPGQIVKTLKIHNVDGLEEINQLPYITPCVKEDILLGSADEEFSIVINKVTKSFKITNQSGTDFILYYNDNRTQGIVIKNNTMYIANIADPAVDVDLKKIIIKLISEVSIDRSIIITQFRSINTSN